MTFATEVETCTVCGELLEASAARCCAECGGPGHRACLRECAACESLFCDADFGPAVACRGCTERGGTAALERDQVEADAV